MIWKCRYLCVIIGANRPEFRQNFHFEIWAKNNFVHVLYNSLSDKRFFSSSNFFVQNSPKHFQNDCQTMVLQDLKKNVIWNSDSSVNWRLYVYLFIFYLFMCDLMTKTVVTLI